MRPIPSSYVAVASLVRVVPSVPLSTVTSISRIALLPASSQPSSAAVTVPPDSEQGAASVAVAGRLCHEHDTNVVPAGRSSVIVGDTAAPGTAPTALVRFNVYETVCPGSAWTRPSSLVSETSGDGGCSK